VRTNSKYTKKRGIPFAVRDIVTIVMTAGFATKGDLARIDFFSGRYTHKKLINGGAKMKRYSMNLELVELDTEY
jgi:hypothetical protein